MNMRDLIRLAGGNIELTSDEGALCITFAPNANKSVSSMLHARIGAIKADLPEAYRLDPKPLIRAMGSSKVERVEVAPSATKTARLTFSGPDWSVTLPADVEKPLAMTPAVTTSMELQTTDLLALVKGCGPCSALWNRYGLNGLHFELEGASLVAVATNGSMLRRMSRPAEGAWAMPRTDNLVPVQPLQTLLTMCSPSVRIGYTIGAERPKKADGTPGGREQGWIHLTSNTLSATFRTPGGEFPDWKSILTPRTVPTRIEVDAVALRKLLPRFEKYISFSAAQDRLTLSDEAGDLNVSLPATLIGVPGDCRYQLSIMQKALAGHKRVVLDIAPDLGPALICPMIGSEIGPWSDIVMPCKKG